MDSTSGESLRGWTLDNGEQVLLEGEYGRLRTSAWARRRALRLTSNSHGRGSPSDDGSCA